MVREQGWECPKCERVWAPKIAACGWCNHTAARRIVRSQHVLPEWNFTADDQSWMD